MDTDTRQGVKLLTNAAVASRDPAALDAINSFVTVQRVELGSVLDDDLAPANRSRVLRSLSLLDSVSKRADSLRTALSCGGAVSAGADKLGPKPRECAASPTSAATDRRRAAQDRPTQPQTPDRQRTETAGAGTDARADVTPPKAPAKQNGAPATPGPAPDTGHRPAIAPADPPATEENNEGQSVVDQVGQILGDLLG
jgi:hypothetical protein